LILALAAFFITGEGHAQALQKMPEAAGDVWHWSEQCESPNRIAVRVSLDGKAVYQTTIPLCRMKRVDIPDGEKQHILVFFLREPNRSLLGETVGARIEGNIWEAGDDPDCVILGVSAVGNHRILMNSLHMADIDRPQLSRFGRGLTIRTYPVAGGRS
jgi:hypothetical protein